MRRVFVMTTGTATLALGCWLLVSAGTGAADDPSGKPVLPEPDFMKLATHDIKVIQDALGKARYLIFYLVGGVAAGAAHILTSYSSMVPTVGASGAIAAVLGGYLYLYPGARVRTAQSDGAGSGFDVLSMDGVSRGTGRANS